MSLKIIVYLLVIHATQFLLLLAVAVFVKCYVFLSYLKKNCRHFNIFLNLEGKNYYNNNLDSLVTLL